MVSGNSKNRRRNRRKSEEKSLEKRPVEEKPSLVVEPGMEGEKRWKKRTKRPSWRKNGNGGNRGRDQKANTNTNRGNKGQRAPQLPQRRQRGENTGRPKRRVPAMNLVSALGPKVNVIQYQPPPYTIMPPRFCDQSKMTIIRLKNIDIGVDESLLFWAFKQFGWIDNVYVVQRSFDYRQTGVAFIGYRSDVDAMRAASQSGCVQLFGRRIFAEIYAYRRKKPHVLGLPPSVLERIFYFLDWQSRIRCESVCRKWSGILKEMHQRGSDPANANKPKYIWNGFPKRVNFSFYHDSDRENKESETETAIDPSTIQIRVPSDVESFNRVLRSVLRKFYWNVSGLEFHNLALNYDTVTLISSGGCSIVGQLWNAGRIFMKNCMLNDIDLCEFLNLMQFYGERFVAE